MTFFETEPSYWPKDGGRDVRETESISRPQENAGIANSIDDCPGTECCARLRRLKSGDKDRHAYPTPGCDLPGKRFVRSLLWDLSQRDQSSRRAGIPCAAGNSDGEWFQQCPAEQQPQPEPGERHRRHQPVPPGSFPVGNCRSEP